MQNRNTFLHLKLTMYNLVHDGLSQIISVIVGEKKNLKFIFLIIKPKFYSKALTKMGSSPSV